MRSAHTETLSQGWQLELHHTCQTTLPICRSETLALCSDAQGLRRNSQGYSASELFLSSVAPDLLMFLMWVASYYSYSVAVALNLASLQ